MYDRSVRVTETAGVKSLARVVEPIFRTHLGPFQQPFSNAAGQIDQIFRRRAEWAMRLYSISDLSVLREARKSPLPLARGGSDRSASSRSPGARRSAVQHRGNSNPTARRPDRPSPAILPGTPGKGIGHGRRRRTNLSRAAIHEDRQEAEESLSIDPAPH